MFRTLFGALVLNCLYESMRKKRTQKNNYYQVISLKINKDTTY